MNDLELKQEMIMENCQLLAKEIANFRDLIEEMDNSIVRAIEAARNQCRALVLGDGESEDELSDFDNIISALDAFRDVVRDKMARKTAGWVDALRVAIEKNRKIKVAQETLKSVGLVIKEGA